MSDEYTEFVASLIAKSGGWKRFPKLKEELESWRPFWSSLRKEDQAVFKRALVSAWDFADAIEEYSYAGMSPTEALQLSIILAQQKMLERIYHMRAGKPTDSSVG
jgi:hypothetical protein